VPVLGFAELKVRVHSPLQRRVTQTIRSSACDALAFMMLPSAPAAAAVEIQFVMTSGCLPLPPASTASGSGEIVAVEPAVLALQFPSSPQTK
jgi:hypothetical protein